MGCHPDSRTPGSTKAICRNAWRTPSRTMAALTCLGIAATIGNDPPRGGARSDIRRAFRAKGCASSQHSVSRNRAAHKKTTFHSLAWVRHASGRWWRRGQGGWWLPRSHSHGNGKLRSASIEGRMASTRANLQSNEGRLQPTGAENANICMARLWSGGGRILQHAVVVTYMQES